MRSHAEAAAPLDARLLDFNTCRRILGRLTAEGFLRRLPDGTYSCQCHGSH